MGNERYCNELIGDRNARDYSLCCVTYRNKVGNGEEHSYMTGTLVNGRKICIREVDFKNNCFICEGGKRDGYCIEKYVSNLLYKIQMGSR